MLQKSIDPTSKHVKVCELCKGNGIIAVIVLPPAKARIEVTKAGVEETVGYTDKSFVRCRCSRGDRFKQFALFNHQHCVLDRPDGAKIHDEAVHFDEFTMDQYVSHRIRQQDIET